MICKVLRLSSGETIIGNVAEESRSYIDVHRPLRVVIHPNNNGTLGIALVRWEPIADFDYPARIFKQALVSVTEPSEEFKENYVEIYQKYDTKEFDLEEKKESSPNEQLSDDLNKIEDMLKSMMQSNTKHTLH